MQDLRETHELLRMAESVLDSAAKLVVETKRLIEQARRIRQESHSTPGGGDEV